MSQKRKQSVRYPKQVHVRVPEGWVDYIDVASATQRLTPSDWLRRAIKNQLERDIPTAMEKETV